MVQNDALNEAEGRRQRGRPRSFDPDAVLTRVRHSFWRNGYAATTMDELAAAAGLHKPSLYGAFGDKKSLYLESLNHYLAEVSEQFAAALSIPRLADSLDALVDASIAKFTRERAGGCYMMSTAVPEAADDPEIGAVVRGAMERLDQALVRRFERAIADGELSGSADPEALAMIVVANHYELSSRARAGFSVDELRARAARALALVNQLGGSAGQGAS